MLEYYLLQFFQVSAPVFVAVGFLYIVGKARILITGIGETKESAIKNMKERTGNPDIETRRIF